MDFSDKMHCSGMGFREYIEALEVERKKIQVFERELPLCLELVNQTIDRCKQQLSGTTTTTEFLHGHSECSEQTSSEAHVYEEFIPLKRSSSSDNDHDEDEDEEEEEEEQSPKRKTIEKDNKKKADWLRSVQLWNNPTPDPPQKELELPKKASVVEVKRNGGAFQPFQREKKVEKGNGSSSGCTAPVATAPATSSNAGTVTGGGSGKREEQKEGQTQRKQRRNWSPELHKRFLNALQQLGGSHAATPKQIRELMKVDGLTNDEVKSHLQKYRLHTRRPTPAIHNNGNAQTPQVVFVGGIWMQPSEYAAAVATATGGVCDPSSAAANGVYAPVAAPPPAIQHIAVHRPQQNKQSSEPSHSEERVMSHSEGGLHSNSPATSSSTHTATTSPAF